MKNPKTRYELIIRDGEKFISVGGHDDLPEFADVVEDAFVGMMQRPKDEDIRPEWFGWGLPTQTPSWLEWK